MDASKSHPVTAKAIDTLKRRLDGATIDWALICGSGIGKGMVAEGSGLGLEIEWTIPLAELGLPAPSVAGHGQSLVYGKIGERRVCVQTGRIHAYEGHPIATCTAALAAMLACGAKGVALTCAAGGLSPLLIPGELGIIRDQLNLFGPTPLVGPRFIPCGAIYTPAHRERLQEIAAAKGLGQGGRLREVVYAYVRGPQYETPSETEALRRLGGDVVGMSTTYEALLAAAEGASLLGISVITNVAGVVGLSHTEVQERSDAVLPELASLLGAALAGDPVVS